MMQFDEAPDKSLTFDPEDTKQKQLALSKAYREAYDVVEAIDADLSEAKKIKQATCEALHDFLVAEGIDNIKNKYGSFGPKTVENVGIVKAREQEVFELLEELGLGASIKRAVHFQTLQKHVRDGMIEVEDGDPRFTKWSVKKITLRRTL